MSINNKNSELTDVYIKSIINMIKELKEAENFLDKILNNKLKKDQNFVLLDKVWLDKWKNIVGFENLNEKCLKCKTDEDLKKLIIEARDLFIQLDTKQKLDELGKMDCSNLIIISGKKRLINFESNFIPILSSQCIYSLKLINKPFTINSEISNGIIFIHDQFPDKDKEQKLILLYKNNPQSNDFIRPVITLESKVNIKNVVKELQKKKIDEIMKQTDYKIEIIKPKDIIENNENKDKKRKEAEAEGEKKRLEQEEEKKRLEQAAKLKIKQEEIGKKLKAEQKQKEEDEERKKKEDEERKKKEDEERKKKEDEERKKKEDEERKKKEDEERKKKEDEERKKKEDEERKKKEDEERKKKDDEERKKKEDEERKKKDDEERKKKEDEERKKKDDEVEINRKKLEKEREEKKAEKKKEELEDQGPVNVKKEEEKNKNDLADAMKKQMQFDKKIKNGEILDENFLISCSIINKKWFDKFIQLSNYESIKEKLSNNQNITNEEIQKAIDEKKVKFDEINNLIKKKPEPINAQALDNIENLAFVDDEFAAKILSLGENNNENANVNNINTNNNNQISLEQPVKKTQIIINKGAAVIQLNEQKFVCANIQNADLNKRDNIEIIDFPKEQKIDLFKEIKNNNAKKGLREIAKEKYIQNVIKKSDPIPPKPEIPPKPQIPNYLGDKDYSLGLDNVGATCYMNATLQCLAHIKNISNHIIKYKEEGIFKDITTHKLSEAYSEVVSEIWLPKDNTKKSFAPKRFKDVLGKMNELFAPTAANDAKDLLIYFIEQMHNELNKSKEKNMNLIMPDDMNPSNLQQVRICFFEEFTKKYKSVFSDYCYGSTVSTTLCHNCRTCKFSYQCFSFIIFPLLEAKKYCVTSGRLHPMFYNQYILNIEDCFLYNQKVEQFTGNNQMYCNICNASKDSSMWTKISTAPFVLILILNRGRGNLDFKESFIFWEIIDLTNYVEFRQPNNKLYLSGVVSHMGDSGPSGHFIAYCKMSPNSKWYKYNDSIVSESDFQEVNRIGTPYILFYQKM